MIDLAILGLLREQDLHGYELRKQASELAGLRPALSFGALYPALARLEAAGAVQAVDPTRARSAREPVVPLLPLTGSLSGEAAAFLARKRAERAERAERAQRTERAERPTTGRGRKVYGLTDAGRQLLVELIEDPSTDDRSFPLKVAFCRYLTPARRLELFERRRATLAGRLAGERSSRRPDQRVTERLDRYLRSLREHDHQTIQHDIAWLDELIANERTALTATAAGREEDSAP
jgi:DNA-binding PadR family transcriptional regulator